MSSIISAIGTATPSNRFSQSEILEFMTDAHQLNPNDTSRLKKLYELSGIDYRHSVIPDFGMKRGKYHFFGNGISLEPYPTTKTRSALYESEAVSVCKNAVYNLKEHLPEFDFQHISHLITVSCTGLYAPGLDIDLIEQMDLSPSTERICINFMGCYGAFNALKTADYICRAEATAKVLIVDVELCTLHFQRENTLQNWLSNSLFADGAAAVLIESQENTSSGHGGALLKTFYNELALEAKDEMAWRIGDTGFTMQLSSQIAKNIGNKINAVTNRLLNKAKLQAGQIDSVAVHPGGRRILEVCQEKLGPLSLKHSFNVLKEYGNMSSATILFVLQKLLSEARPGNLIMGFAFGPGLTIESMILETI